MIESDPDQFRATRGAGRPLRQFVLLSVALLFGLDMTAVWLFGAGLVPAALFLVIVAISFRGVLSHFAHSEFGLCNTVTLFRATLVALLSGAIFAPSALPWFVFSIATFAFLMDGLDGWLARKSGMESDFGARFDMEIDALLGAVLALILLAGGTVGPEILVLGFMRYAFVIASVFVPALQGPLPERFRRKVICVVQIAALIFLLLPVAPAALLMPVSYFAAALLFWSFAVDSHWLLKEAK